MNYIKHLNKTIQLFYEDNRLLPSHISLYLALFYIWNEHRFQNPISINRTEVMKTAKISSLSTYTKCLRQLHEWQYLEYIPSYNPLLGTQVNLYDFCTGICTTNYTATQSISVQPSVQLPYINNINTNKDSEIDSPPNELEVIKFFKEKLLSEKEAKKFYNHYTANGWKMGGKTPIKNWQAAAEKWILNIAQFNSNERSNQNYKTGNLHTSNSKNFSEPL